ncbi:UDP-N-acetylmuramoyl-L-alanine--D-glutamate ligase [Kineothrix sp. MSJ-39]|uniref:UDP-N-acetylmuramoyl-L-alanine--D-glutamate ligase n=1 Tax=Kineothrix sp. MSJ-39 TaxID=2841533 RepID=UPI001C0F445C|nr:UDP-N-acetylmuramoyl-L-alanine--D-glutamate ligase [Kineothrix sp. MSJ-39]MBU5429562.1 UDP-N-acetylmuramoyl-L-alanine--D-glutamate ligase [Kineothrix sp. MSJ-39]
MEKEKVLVVGTGKSGIAATQLLVKTGKRSVLFDSNAELDKDEILGKLSLSEDEKKQVEIVLGDLTEEEKKALSGVVLSPGVPTDTEFVNDLRDRGLPISGEIELAFEQEKGAVLAITGTNGKTTTTTLLGEIMKATGRKTFVVGNIGNPYTLEAEKADADSVTVAEISSFQLETIHTFRPRVSAILNITPDHLNRHHTMENYVKAKQDITKNQTKEDYCVLNAEDPYTDAFLKTCPATVILFSSQRELADGYFYADECIYKAVQGKKQKLMNIHEMRLLGMHNVENVMAAIAMADAYGVDMEVILGVVRDFKAVEHRIEYVKTVRGVDYYNDSKGTNPDAAIKGIGAMVKPTYLIGGGYDKQSEYDEWIECFNGKVRKLVLLGQTREKIADCAKKHGFTDYIFVDDLQQAVDYCAEHAKEGEAVLLSPACASWGMFPNYEVRGKMFKDMVNAL